MAWPENCHRLVFSTAASMLAVVLSANLILALGNYFWLALAIDLVLLFDTYRTQCSSPRILKATGVLSSNTQLLCSTIVFLTRRSTAVAPWAFPASQIKDWTIATANSNDVAAWLLRS